ncbi:non-contractile tail sheath protein [Sphingobium yanoikuyae]|uniref:non-contractile tail sheath protein n=1 Tax=Sphingobium yanoikuyae TaxID=13690 RepID=UPI003F690A44
MGYLQAVAGAFVSIGLDAEIPILFQVGEPWWWVMPGDGRICIYDDAARLALDGSPVSIADVRGALSAAQCDLLDAAGAVLAASTATLCAAVRALAPDAGDASSGLSADRAGPAGAGSQAGEHAGRLGGAGVRCAANWKIMTG